MIVLFASICGICVPERVEDESGGKLFQNRLSLYCGVRLNWVASGMLVMASMEPKVLEAVSDSFGLACLYSHSDAAVPREL